MDTSKKKLSLLSFFAITASMVMTVYEYPTFATSKMNLVFYLLVGGFLWFIPVALCSAEMATVKGWEKGGLYTWVSKTLGRKWGFAAIFFQWFQITVGFITMIYFIVGALSYALNWPALNTNVWLKLIATLVIFWLITISQFGGTKNTAKIAKVGFFVGIVATGIILFILGIVYIAQGNPVKVSFGSGAWIPDFTKINTLVVLDTLGGATVAATIPQNQLSLDTGVIQAYSYLIHHFGGGEWLVRLIAVVICLGVIAEIAAWVVGPSTAMLEAAENGLLPKQMAKVNQHNVPINIVLVQGIIVSIWAVVLTLGGGGANLSFFVAMALTVCIYLVAYVLLFLSYIKLVKEKDDLTRTYHIPGGKNVKIGVAMVGLLVSIFSFFISFFPPSDIGTGKGGTYLAILIISWLIIVVIPFVIYKYVGEKASDKK